MKFWFGTPGWGWRLWGVSSGDKWFFGLSIKQGASHDRLLAQQPAAVDGPDAQAAEIEALRAEVSGLRAARIAYANEFPATEDGDPDTGNIHANIRALKDRAEQLAAEVESLRALCAAAYQMAGVHDAPVEWLDALSNAASGRPFSTDGLLPYMPQAVCEAEVRALELEREIEALRAEVAEAREFRDKMANAIGNDQLRRFIEKHGEPVPLTIRMQAAEARVERLEAEVERVTCELMDAITRADKLAEALKEIRSRSSIDLVMRSDQFELTALLGDIYHIADAALAQEDDQ